MPMALRRDLVFLGISLYKLSAVSKVMIFVITEKPAQLNIMVRLTKKCGCFCFSVFSRNFLLFRNTK